MREERENGEKIIEVGDYGVLGKHDHFLFLFIYLFWQSGTWFILGINKAGESNQKKKKLVKTNILKTFFMIIERLQFFYHEIKEL